MSATKVTLTLPTELLDVVDRFVAMHNGVTRSGVCADALRGWLQAEQEHEIERYYAEMSDDERQEDAAWASLSAQSSHRRWE